jgi:protein-disulfide isomerase
MRQAEAAGITGLPAVFINGGEVTEDALFSLETYIAIIEALLAR